MIMKMQFGMSGIRKYMVVASVDIDSDFKHNPLCVFLMIF